MTSRRSGRNAPQTPVDGRAAEASGSFWARHRRGLTVVMGALVAAAFIYFVLPQIEGLGPTLRRLRGGRIQWLAVAAGLEAVSMLGDIVMFRGVFAARGTPIGWQRIADLRMAGAAATKLLAAAGSGGVALTVTTLRSWGFSTEDVADGMVCYLILTYAVYLTTLALAGFGLWFGVFSGKAPLGLTLIPASLATAAILVVLSMLYLSAPAKRFLQRRAEDSTGRAADRWRRAAALPQTIHAGLLAALEMVRRRDLSLFGALAYWGFDIGALWGSFRAFGHSPPGAVLVAGYFIGTLGNALPLPGGIGGVEGGMIGAFLGFGVKASLATLAVLAYRTISYWLPTGPGAIAYFHLRHSSDPRTVAAGHEP